MVSSGVHTAAWLEMVVMVFQVVGVLTLCANRLLPHSRWREWGRVGFVVTMIGLGVAGALCGQHDSEFALFAGGTMTFLLIGMTVGNGHADTTTVTYTRMAPEAAPAG